MTSVVFKAFQQIQDKGEVRLFKSHRDGFADGEQIRDFIYVKDAVKVLINLMEHKVGSGIYNLGTGKARTFKDLVLATFKALGKDPKIVYYDMPENLRDQYQYYTQAEMDKLQNSQATLEFPPLEESVKDYVQDHLMQKSPYLDKKVKDRYAKL